MTYRFAPIAIVGAGCVVPGASSRHELWELVASGRDAISDTPPGRWRIDGDRIATRPESPMPERTWSTRGGYAGQIAELFDANGFGVPAEQLDTLDPLFHLLLHTGREALRDAGRWGAELGRSGVIVGNLSYPTSAMSHFAESVWLRDQGALPAPETLDARNRFMSGLPAQLAARALGCDYGFALDAACASSLYAIALACARLQAGELDVALAGAVNRADDLFIHVGFCSLGAISRSGRSRPLDASADGLLPAEGAAMVALQRLDDAVASGRRILGVIRGVGLSNDGRGRGFLAPLRDGQLRAITDAYAQAGLSPHDISYVECHATGTPVGDATEIESLKTFFGTDRELPIGSLKSNLGHLVTAAGAAGLIKVLGALEHRTLPPTLHVDTPLAALAGTRLKPVLQVMPWQSEGVRRAGVSAFGFGGNNAHLIVEEWTGQALEAPQPVSRSLRLAVLGVGAVATGVGDVAELAAALGSAAPLSSNTAPSVRIDPTTLRFPPRELQRSLPQQNLVLRAAIDAIDGVRLENAALGVVVGMGADAEVCRYGLRWRLGELLPSAEPGQSDVIAPLDADGVVGAMPNIPANRLNRQLDAEAFGFTVSAEERSGIEALRIAADALSRLAADAVLVAAVDLCVEPVHRAALAQVLGREVTPGDAAVAMLVCDERDAARLGARVLATLELPVGATHVTGAPVQDGAATRRFGHTHAALALLELAAGMKKGGSGEVVVDTIGGERDRVDFSAHAEASAPKAPSRSAGVALPSHLPPVRLTNEVRTLRNRPAHVPLPAAPALPSVFSTTPGAIRVEGASQPAPVTEPAVRPTVAALPARNAVAAVAAPAPTAEPLASPAAAALQHHAWITAQHQAHIALTASMYAQFQAIRAQQAAALAAAARGFDGVATQTSVAAAAPTSVPAPSRPVALAPAPVLAPAELTMPVAPVSSPTQVVAPTVVAPAVAAAATLPGPKLDRAALEFMSRHEISRYFGPLFEQQDGWALQVRMPTPPMLLCDRVLGIAGEAGSMGRGTMWTETDVSPDAWYLHDGAMPAGIMIESGQADLLLISWLGIDFLNRGERAYRLLGCELTWHGGMPRIGDTLRYEIHVDGHAKHGDIRMFFFHYDCRIGETVRLQVREGQAGFFSKAELDESMGVLWDPADETPEGPAPTPGPHASSREDFDRDALIAFSQGHVAGCFGSTHWLASTHTRTPRIAGGRMMLLGDALHIDLDGGPWKRGYLRAVDAIAPDDWFFEGHFHNDPCMPGTLMFEGALQAMAFYMTALGLTLERDGWRFEPVCDVPYLLRCRGQVVPTSRELVYEIFVREVRDGNEPQLWADLLCTVDGLKAFHCRAMGLRLVPDWPQSTAPRLPTSGRPVASIGPLATDENAMFASALGRPTDAFGALYADFAAYRRIPRLPGPPYLFISRMAHIEGDWGSRRAGARVVAEYDVPPDAWYFDESGIPGVANPGAMPYAVLVEAALQPCGWLASYLGGALVSDGDLLFRNLDGRGVLHDAIRRGAGRLVTDVRCTKWSQSGETIIVAFDVTCDLDGVRVYDLQTVFGFFPPAALATQVGLPPSPQHAALLTAPSADMVPLRARALVSDARVDAAGALELIDRIGLVDVSAPWVAGVRAEKDVVAAEWFFKAHFFQDPVMPGSLGLEQMLQALQWWLRQREPAAARDAVRFDPIGLGAAFTWRYRGQVIPARKLVAITLAVRSVDDRGDRVDAVASASLWVDGLRIYDADDLSMTMWRPA